VPSINLGIRASWEHYVESLRDLLSDKDITDPEAAVLVSKLLGDAQSAPASQRAQKLFRFVTDKIEPTDDVFGLAPSMLSARTGSPERVLRYLLSLAGISSELALVRGAEADHSTAALPDPETYGYLLLRVATENGPVWLHAGARHAPFGFLPPQVRGEQALVLNSSAERATLPQADPRADSRDVDVTITLGKQGKAELKVRETHRGQSAVSWRNDLDDVPQAELEARFEESYASKIVPGGKLKSVSFEKRDEPEAPLVIAYTLEVDRLGHRVGDELRVPGLFPASLQAQFAREAQRSTPLLVAPGANSTVHVRVLLPKGAKVQAMPKPSKLDFNQARFESVVTSDAQQLDVMRTLRVPLMRVAPSDYSTFAAFCRAVDLAEASELAIALP